MSQITVAVRYPLQEGTITLRTDLDWDLDVQPLEVLEDGTLWVFEVPCEGPFLYFKPCLHVYEDTHWSKGGNYLLTSSSNKQEIFPYFFYEGGTFSREPEIFPTADGKRSHRVRVYHPAGYHENYFAHYPVLYMHDGHNLFFPREAFTGATWQISETLELMDRMNALKSVIVVGIYPEDRMTEYTNPGYYEYGDFIVNDLMPKLESELRALKGPENTAVMGSSLGGLVSFHLAWRWPEVFGQAACLSSTFSFQDDLIEAVRTEEPRDVRFYIDSGWPGDNYEVTRNMCDLLLRRGYEWGKDLMYLSFPNASHTESDWAHRCHIPLQFFFQDHYRKP